MCLLCFNTRLLSFESGHSRPKKIIETINFTLRLPTRSGAYRVHERVVHTARSKELCGPLVPFLSTSESRQWKELHMRICQAGKYCKFFDENKHNFNNPQVYLKNQDQRYITFHNLRLWSRIHETGMRRICWSSFCCCQVWALGSE